METIFFECHKFHLNAGPWTQATNEYLSPLVTGATSCKVYEGKETIIPFSFLIIVGSYDVYNLSSPPSYSSGSESWTTMLNFLLWGIFQFNGSTWLL